MRLLPFFMRESLAIIKIYPRRVVFELPKIDVIASKLRVMEIDGRIFVVGDLPEVALGLEGEVGCALGKDKDAVIHVGDVEGPVACNRTTSSYTRSSSTRVGVGCLW